MGISPKWHSCLIAVANLLVAVLVFYGMYLMNQDPDGAKSVPVLSVPLGLMMAGIYEFCYLALTDGRSNRTKWLVLSVLGLVSLAFLWGTT